MQTQMMIALGLSTVLAGIVGGMLLSGDETGIETTPVSALQETPEVTGPQDPFMQEYQELERLLEETRAQRKQQQIQLADQMGVEPPAVAVADQEKAASDNKAAAEAEPESGPTVEVDTVASVEEGANSPNEEKEKLTAPKPVEPVKEEPRPVAKAAVEKVSPEPAPELAPKPKEPQLKVVQQPVEVAKKVEAKPASSVTDEGEQSSPEPESKAEASSIAKPVAPSKPAAPKKSTPKPKAKPKTKSKPLNKRKKHIQLATFTSRKRAEAVVADLRDSEFSAEVVAVTSRGKRYYLVRDYSPKNRQEALRLKKVYDNWLKIDSLVRY